MPGILGDCFVDGPARDLSVRVKTVSPTHLSVPSFADGALNTQPLQNLLGQKQVAAYSHHPIVTIESLTGKGRSARVVQLIHCGRFVRYSERSVGVGT
jgi:hypothetical protein